MHKLKGEYVNWYKDAMLGDSAANEGMVSGRQGCDWKTAIEEIVAYSQTIPTLEYRFTEVDQPNPDGTTTHSMINLMAEVRHLIEKRSTEQDAPQSYSMARVA